VTRRLFALIVAVALAVTGLLVANASGAGGAGAIPGQDWIQGTVTSTAGKPEAGVWVIAESNELPVPPLPDLAPAHYRKIVVTDDQGRFVLPQLPVAQYDVWVRGYGLKDSDRVSAAPGETLALEAEPAANAQEAAKVFPANYWLSIFNPPNWGNSGTQQFKLGCELCHQIGSPPTRALDEGTTPAAYDSVLHEAATMSATADGLPSGAEGGGGAPGAGRAALLNALADWATRIAQGATPPTPPRPSGVERNMVITEWGWGSTYTYAHDEIATDNRNPTVNANGPIYGVDLANDHILSLDPVTNAASQVHIPTANDFSTPWCNQTFVPASGGPPQPNGFGTLGCPAAGGSTDVPGVYDNPANPHTLTMDASGKIWFTTQIRREWAQDLPAFCKSDPVILNNGHHRQLGMYDPATGHIELIDTCFGTHHLNFDAKGILWLSGDTHVLGWFDPSKYNPADPSTLQQAEHWAEMKVDSNGDGTADKPIVGFNYGIVADAPDGSVWTAQPSAPGRIMRYDPASGTFEAYTPPEPYGGPRGLDVDSKGNVWVSLGGSGALAEFDRSKCPHTWGTGDQCPQGWTVYPDPGPRMRGTPTQSADFNYEMWIDRYNTLGMGNDVVVENGTGSDSLLVFDPSKAGPPSAKDNPGWTIIRIPYPIDTFTRLVDGRIDDASAGWKGRGLWFDNGLDPLLHSEIQQSYVGHVQMRPNPLAK
jgi:streptogramin lyase